MSRVNSEMRAQFVMTVLHNTRVLSILLVYSLSVSYILCKKLRSHSKIDACNFSFYAVSEYIQFYTALVGLMTDTES
jgi:hypothetical protein